jgi:hypothetical protein
MPKQKDLKRLARTRMQKTGESYTAARSQLLKKKSAPANTVVKEADYDRLAGMNDEAVHAKTGCTWKRWVRLLDAVDAASWSHRDIAQYVHDNFEVSGWWAQTVTVGYERIRGLRDVGQRRGGTYDCNRSKTYPVPIATLYKMCNTTRQRSRWLPGVKLTLRKATAEKSLRLLWEDGTPLEMYFTAKGPDKSHVAIQHRKLPSSAELTRKKTYWAERLTALGELLTSTKWR